MAFGGDQARDTNTPAAQAQESTRAVSDGQQTGDVTLGRVKELTPQRIVIDVDNRLDKSFDPRDRETRFSIPGTLRVGDPVKVIEGSDQGHKVVTIVIDDNPNVKHGDRTAEELRENQPSTAVRTDEPAVAAEGDVVYGRVKELRAGQKLVIEREDAVDKNYDLTDARTRYKVASGLKVGDMVKVTESDQDDRKVVTVTQGQPEKHVRTDETRDVREPGESAKDAGKSAGRSAKEAGRAAGRAAKDAGKAVGRGAKQAGEAITGKDPRDR